MIHGICVVPPEHRSAKWPEVFVSVPRVGDWVESSKGQRLRVVQITHRLSYTAVAVGAPVIEVELA